MLRKYLFLFVTSIICLVQSFALAQVINPREFPQGTKRGVLNMSNFPDILIDGKVRQTLPGTRYYNKENILELPNYLEGKYIIINYLENHLGEIEKIWILTDEERTKVLPKVEPWRPKPIKDPNSF